MLEIFSYKNIQKQYIYIYLLSSYNFYNLSDYLYFFFKYNFFEKIDYNLLLLNNFFFINYNLKQTLSQYLNVKLFIKQYSKKKNSRKNNKTFSIDNVIKDVSEGNTENSNINNAENIKKKQNNCLFFNNSFKKFSHYEKLYLSYFYIIHFFLKFSKKLVKYETLKKISHTFLLPKYRKIYFFFKKNYFNKTLSALKLTNNHINMIYYDEIINLQISYNHYVKILAISNFTKNLDNLNIIFFNKFKTQKTQKTQKIQKTPKLKKTQKTLKLKKIRKLKEIRKSYKPENFINLKISSLINNYKFISKKFSKNSVLFSKTVFTKKSKNIIKSSKYFHTKTYLKSLKIINFLKNLKKKNLNKFYEITNGYRSDSFEVFDIFKNNAPYNNILSSDDLQKIVNTYVDNVEFNRNKALTSKKRSVFKSNVFKNLNREGLFLINEDIALSNFEKTYELIEDKKYIDLYESSDLEEEYCLYTNIYFEEEYLDSLDPIERAAFVEEREASLMPKKKIEGFVYKDNVDSDFSPEVLVATHFGNSISEDTRNLLIYYADDIKDDVIRNDFLVFIKNTFNYKDKSKKNEFDIYQLIADNNNSIDYETFLKLKNVIDFFEENITINIIDTSYEDFYAPIELTLNNLQTYLTNNYKYFFKNFQFSFSFDKLMSKKEINKLKKKTIN